jgi:tetratricopeptide (TPR) repeat protein
LSKGDIKKQGQYNQAVNRLSATDWFDKGYTYLAAEKYQDAINAYTRAIELDPKFAPAYNNRGVSYNVLGNHNQAIADHTRAIELNPKDAGAYFVRGLAYEESGNLEQAFSDYKVAARLGFKPAQDFLRGKGTNW